MEPVKENEGRIGKVEGKVAELKAMSDEISSLSLAIESFLLGNAPTPAVEETDKKAPSGWLDIQHENLDNIKSTLGYALNSLRAVRFISK